MSSPRLCLFLGWLDCLICLLARSLKMVKGEFSRETMVFQKRSPPLKLFGIFSLQLSLLRESLQICWQFISTYICQFLYIFKNITFFHQYASFSRRQVWMQTLREQGLGEKAIIPSDTLTGWKLSIDKKVCSRVDHTGSSVLRKPGSGTRRPAIASACAVCRCKTIFPLVGPTKL